MTHSLVNGLDGLIAVRDNAPGVVELPADAPFDAEQRQWLSGLLTGLSALTAGGAPEKAAAPPLNIYYGSQSGNAEALARDLRKFAGGRGFAPALAELDSLDPAALQTMRHLLIICSTFGEGEPPDNARGFYERLMSDAAAPLPAGLNFAVCGLGDSSYPDFNQCATDIHARLLELGATACHELAACDVGFEDDYAAWKAAVFATPAFADAAGQPTAAPAAGEDAGPVYSKQRPFLATLKGARSLSGLASGKRVNHIEISLAGGGQDLRYEPGDTLGVWPLNCPEEVEAILEAGGFDGDEIVRVNAEAAPLRVWLQSRLDIITVNAAALKTWGLDAAPEGHHVVDVLARLKPGLDAQRLVDGLRPLQARLYSIASSPKAHPGEAHLTVAEVRYEQFERKCKGVASAWLGNRLAPGSHLGVYVQASPHFHLPKDDNAPLIMIGPGTGIAPFRAFLEEREARGASGDNWLFFGDRREADDFLYKAQLLRWRENKLLTRLDLAWSRDGAQKVYVQNHIRQNGRTFFEWLERGACVYVCGDAARMAKDVDAAIHALIAEHGRLDQAGAAQYVKKLADERRYQRDVY